MVKIKSTLGKLTKKLAVEHFKRDFYKFDASDVITGVYALRHGILDVFDTQQSQLVLEAIKRSTNDLGEGSSIEDIRDYLSGYSDVQIEGIVNNVKGIYHELKFELDENSDDDGIMAELFAETNHPDSDVILINTETGEREFVQLKATDDVSYINDAIDKNPDIKVISTQEVAEKLEIDSSGMSNEELNEEVSEAIDRLRNPKELVDDLPDMIIWSTIFSILPIISKLVKREINISVAIKAIGRITGLKTVRVVALIGLLSFPATAIPTSVYMIAKYSTMVYKVLLAKEVT